MAYASADNLFGLSPFIVDPTGVSGSYTTINSALVAAATAGGGTIYVRYKSTPYVENITWPEKCDIIGVCGDGRLGQVVVEGTIDCSSQGEHTALNMRFQNTANNTPLLTVNPAGVVSVLAFENCYMQTTAGAPIMSLSHVGIGSGVSVVASQTDFDGSATAFVLTGASFLRHTLCTAATSTGSLVSLTGTAQYQFDNCDLSSELDLVTFASDTCASVGIKSVCSTDTNGSVFDFNGHTATANLYSCVVNVTESSNFWASGSGTVNYCDLMFIGTGTLLDPGISPNPRNWQPYATATTVGTASFSASDFTVSSSGLVSLNSPGHLAWTNRGAPAVVLPNSGSFIDAAITLTLPAPAAQSDICQFVCTSAGPCVIQAQGGDKIFIGTSVSSAGGTATSTAAGDSLYLVYQILTSSWFAVGGPQGTWTLA